MTKATPNTKWNELPPILTPDDLIAALPLGRTTIYEGLRTGAIPARRVGKKYLVSKARLIAWIEADGPSTIV